MTAATTAQTITGQSLTRLVADRASGKEIARFLEGLSPRERVEQVRAVGGRGVAYLYDAAKGAEPLTLEDMVPANESGTVIFEGKNSLPMFTHFQKRFCRLGGQIIGYNHQSMAFAVGPGYFAVRPASDTGEHAGELYFDYTVPAPGRPDGWPEIKPNDRGLSRAVYANMIDYCRRLGPGVLVGHAYKLGVDQKAWFTLTRPR